MSEIRPGGLSTGVVKTRGPAHCTLEEVWIAAAIDRASKTGFARVPSLESSQNGRSHAPVGHFERAQQLEMVEAQRRERGDVTARPCARRGRIVAGCARCLCAILKARVDAPSRGFCARAARALERENCSEMKAKRAGHRRPRPRVVRDGVCAHARHDHVMFGRRLSHRRFLRSRRLQEPACHKNRRARRRDAWNVR